MLETEHPVLRQMRRLLLAYHNNPVEVLAGLELPWKDGT